MANHEVEYCWDSELQEGDCSCCAIGGGIGGILHATCHHPDADFDLPSLDTSLILAESRVETPEDCPLFTEGLHLTHKRVRLEAEKRRVEWVKRETWDDPLARRRRKTLLTEWKQYVRCTVCGSKYGRWVTSETFNAPVGMCRKCRERS